MALGAGFYEELAFRVVLFGLGAKLLVWLFVRQRVGLVGGGPRLGHRGDRHHGRLGPRERGRLQRHALRRARSATTSTRASFVARAVLGLALTLVYASRGFAAAVWTHALYDVWVLVM